MAPDPIASRYAEALFETAKAEGRIEETLETLRVLGGLLAEEPALRQLLWNPDVDPEDKVGVLERVLADAWSQLVRAFLWVVVSLGRSEYLPQIIEAFGEAVDADRGRLRVVVRSAHPLSDAVLERLRAMLERREGKTVELEADLDSQLLGGVQVQLDHRVIDGTVRRQLADLKERLSAIKVH